MDLARRQHTAFVVLRIVLAAIMLIHGIARIYGGKPARFGEFLTLNGFPLGFYLAWGITIFEIVGSIVLASGFYVRILAIIFAVQLLMGIILVHAKEGWFVVGPGRNGAEYSVLLITSFLVIALSYFGKSKT